MSAANCQGSFASDWVHQIYSLSVKVQSIRDGENFIGEINAAIPDVLLNSVINTGFHLSTGNHQGIHCQGFEFVLSGIYRDRGNKFDPFADQ